MYEKYSTFQATRGAVMFTRKLF